jgi:hypothetical protein
VKQAGTGSGRRLSPLQRDIVTFAKEHRTLTDAQIAQHFGQPSTVIAKALGR